jgi:nicotinamide-nucleotide amidase
VNVELVTIGTELLLGFTVDTNGAEIARALAAHGIRIVRRTAIGDRAEDIEQAVSAPGHRW